MSWIIFLVGVIFLFISPPIAIGIFLILAIFSTRPGWRWVYVIIIPLIVIGLVFPVIFPLALLGGGIICMLNK